VTWLEVKEAGAALPVALPVLLVAAVLWDKLLHATAAVAAIASTAAEIIARFFLACFMAILRLSYHSLDSPPQPAGCLWPGFLNLLRPHMGPKQIQKGVGPAGRRRTVSPGPGANSWKTVMNCILRRLSRLPPG
jgi:hypothetical protein